MFEDYIQDSFLFYKLAEKSASTNEREARMYYRASVFCAASSLEAFVNFIGDTLKKGDTMDKNEIAFLNDLALEMSPTKAKIESRTKYYSVDSKIKFILKRFNVPFDTKIATPWRHFIEFKTLRDSLVHPRNQTDELALAEYKNKINSGLNANIDIMNAISKKLFSKPLRKSLTDLKL
jgi:hypothetical protein